MMTKNEILIDAMWGNTQFLKLIKILSIKNKEHFIQANSKLYLNTNLSHLSLPLVEC